MYLSGHTERRPQGKKLSVQTKFSYAAHFYIITIPENARNTQKEKCTNLETIYSSRHFNANQHKAEGVGGIVVCQARAR